MAKQIKLNEQQLRGVVEKAVKKVLNELDLHTIKNSYEKAFNQSFDDTQGRDFTRKRQRQSDAFYKELNNRNGEVANASNMPIKVVGGPLQGEYTKDEFEQKFADQITGYAKFNRNPMFLNSPIVGYPKVRGYVGPMHDGGRIRYETQEVYNDMSM